VIKLKVIYKVNGKKLCEEEAERERKQRYYFRNFTMYAVRSSEVADGVQTVELVRLGGRK
jgi:hypothetical protein